MFYYLNKNSLGDVIRFFNSFGLSFENTDQAIRKTMLFITEVVFDDEKDSLRAEYKIGDYTLYLAGWGDGATIEFSLEK